MADKVDKLRFELVKAPEYRTFAANGAWGGLVAHGFIIMDLYLEQEKNPEFIEHDVDDGIAGAEHRRPEDTTKRIVRERQAGVVLTPEAAEALANWLLGKVEASKKLQAGESEVVDNDGNGHRKDR